MFFIINNPPAVVKAVFIIGGVDKNYFGRIVGIVDKGIGFPLEGLDRRVGVGEVCLLVYWGVERYLVLAFFEFEVHGHAAAEKIGVFVITDDVWGTHPFVSGCDAAGIVSNVLAVLVLYTQKTTDVVENSGIVRPVDD